MYAIRPSLLLGSAVLAVTALAAAPPVLSAQDVQYETITKTSLPGAAGTALRLAARLGGESLEVVERTSIKGRKMRVDSDGSSTITDLENGRIIFLDHEAKTYTSFTFEEMLERAQQASRDARAGATDAERRTVSGDDSAETRVDFTFKVEEARERERVAGYDAERFFLTMQAETEYVPEGGSQREEGGTLVVFTDLWSSKDMPGFTARRAFDESTAQDYAVAGAALTEGIAAAFADDPQLRVAFEQSAEQASRIEGMPVRTVMHFVMVAPGQQFDRVAITDPTPEGGAVQQAARRGLGRLAARAAGVTRQQDAPQSADEATQAIMMTVTSEVRDVITTSLDAQLFEVPAGYTEARLGG
jgi:hypothetical protein